MFVTNDVALITFVPITIMIFAKAGHKKLIFIIVMETLAANLGSMLTPIGNPQNLYIYSFYGLNILSFLRYVLPVGLISYMIIMGLILVFQNGSIEIMLDQRAILGNIKKPLVYYAGLFLLCSAAVLHMCDYRICVLTVVSATLIVDRKLLSRIDYGLLLTFICFFIFAGNLEKRDAVNDFRTICLEGRVFAASILSGQVISNVPAAIMISRFTTDVRQLLLGVNIGGLGTPVASLASLISFKLYFATENSSPAAFLRVFAVYNISILLLLSAMFYS
jgi:Na+/H+ antiporter NhaD/arsenite permease-like protein